MENIINCPYCSKSFNKYGIKSHIWRTHGEGKDFNPNQCYKDGTKQIWCKGLTKETNISIANGAAKRTRKKSALELSVDDDNKLIQKWRNKKVNARAENISFELDYEQYIQLVADAGLKSSQLGFTGEGYVLARINDTGAYAVGNCRFISQIENAREKKITDKIRESSRKNIQICIAKNKLDPMHNYKISQGIRKTEKYKNAKLRQQERENNKDERWAGSKNSQYGTFWITDGVNNMKWSTAKGQFPVGFYKGRILKHQEVDNLGK